MYSRFGENINKRTLKKFELNRTTQSLPPYHFFRNKILQNLTGPGRKLNFKNLKVFFPGCLFLPIYLRKNTWYHSF